MKEYIKIPFWIESIDSIESFMVKKFINITNLEVINKKIDIKYLREIYKYDFNFFLDLVKELSMRGFEFYPLKESNVIPSKKYENIKFYIKIKEDKNIYKDILWDYFQLYNFVERFNIDSDLFFNKIPLEGFKVINKNINLNDFFEYLKQFENIEVREETSCKILEEVKEKMQLIEEDLEELKFEEVKLNEMPINLTFLNNVISRTEVIGIQRKIKEHLLDNLEKYSDILHQNNIEGTQLEDDLSKIKNLGKGRINKYFEVLFKNFKEMNGDDFSEIEIKKTVYSISKIFKENKYNQFRDFLKEKNIQSLLNITDEIMALFKTRPKVGQLRYNQALSKWKEEQIKIDPRIEQERHRKLEKQKYEELMKEQIEIKTFFKDKKIKISAIIDIKNKDIGNLEIDDLEYYFTDDLLTLGFEIDELMMLKKRMKNLISIDELFRSFFSNLKGDEIERLEKRLLMKKTLEVIGKEENLSRERIRQKNVKTLKKLKTGYYKGRLDSIIKVLYKDRTLLTLEDLNSNLKEHNKLIIEILKSKKNEIENNLLNYSLNLGVFLLKDIDEDQLKIDLKNKLPEYFKLEDRIEEIYEILGIYHLDKLPEVNLTLLLENIGYKQQGEVYTLLHINKKNIIEIIFNLYLYKPLFYNEEGFQQLKQICNEKLNCGEIKEDINRNSINNIISNCENILLVDRKTYIHIENYKYESNLIERIEMELESFRGIKNEISINELFEKFERELVEGRVNTKQALYSLLKFYYNDKYIFGKGNTLNIYFTENKLTREKIILKILEKNSNIYTKQALLKKLKWKGFKLEDIIAKSNQLFYIGNDYICNMNYLDLSIDFKILIDKLVMNKLSSNDYVVSKDIFEELQLERIGKKELLKLNINSGDYLSTIIRAIIPNKIKSISRGKFLVLIDSEIRDSEDIFKYVFKDKEMIYRDEIKEFYITNGYAESSSSLYIQRLLDSNILSEIECDKVILTSKFKLENEIIEAVNNYINEEMKGKEYLILNNLKFRNKFKRIENIGIRKWNPHLLRTILLKNYGNEYKNIEKYNSDYRYDKVIITRKDSEIENFNDLIYFILKTEYEGQMQEDKIYDFLSEKKKILLPKTDILSKKLPYEISNNSYKKIKIDELGRIEIL